MEETTTKRIILAGGSGFLGQALAGELAKRGAEVIVLTRAPVRSTEQVRAVAWDGKTLGEWTSVLDGADAVVNLVGKSVHCRYTPVNRREIIDSRVNSVNVLGQAMLQCARPPKAWVQSGSLAIYGDAGDRVCDESAPYGEGFSVETCVRWEQAFNSWTLPNTRKTLLRIGFALGHGGGALELLTKLTKWFLGGRAGSGAQYISWLHIADLNQMFLWAIQRDDIAGVFNATSPQPVTNGEFMRVLRTTLHRPWSPPVPGIAVRLGAFFMRTEADLVLTGRRCVPQRFLDRGFTFQYRDLHTAVQSLLTEGHKTSHHTHQSQQPGDLDR